VPSGTTACLLKRVDARRMTQEEARVSANGSARNAAMGPADSHCEMRTRWVVGLTGRPSFCWEARS